MTAGTPWSEGAHVQAVSSSAVQPNLRQVHLRGIELFDEVARHGHPLRPGDLGENITTSGVDLHALPRGTVLHLGADASVELTGDPPHHALERV